ncbi:hypothetical protein [Nitrospirillum viridazoti]|uniref:Uncharacterized protein n=1 Tax=Nitrospirillum amazonense TaxID=28077 RepID=A0A560ISN2_9PROT|nr:hypothetical protein [Nitrospirillum amazonense]TWB62072.1 hypothetical protein FBZ92_1057 [Nitrospirillum amazonense]
MIALMLTLLAVVVTAGLTGERAWTRVSEAKARRRQALNRQREQSQRIRRLARATYSLKQQRRHIQLSMETLQDECARLEQDIKRIARPENRIFVLEERRNPTDAAWIATVEVGGTVADSALPAAVPWQRRRFLLWAGDDEGARARLERRFPHGSGFRVSQLMLRPNHAAAPPAATSGGLETRAAKTARLAAS